MGDKQELLVLRMQQSIAILVPKRRGVGYLLTPLGHHDCALSDVQYEIGYDIFGLDGMLEVQVGFSSGTIPLDGILQPIAEVLGFQYREVNEGEFWSKHPATKQKEN